MAQKTRFSGIMTAPAAAEPEFIKNEGFTLLEIIVVIVIVSLVAGFAIPRYNRMNLTGLEENVVKTLRRINTANRAYKARNGEYWPLDTGVTHNLDEIVENLDVSIAASNVITYECRGKNESAGGSLMDVFDCEARYSQGGNSYRILVDEWTLTDSAEQDDIRPGQHPPNPCCVTDNCLLILDC